MSDSINPRIKAPSSAGRGELIEIKTLVSHPMESGQRKDKDGNLIPRKILNTFACSFNGRPVFGATLEPAISANPYLAFYMRAMEGGTLEFTWVDDDGSRHTATHALSVS
jgi:sulfur-oxidizing protein SoxZ